MTVAPGGTSGWGTPAGNYYVTAYGYDAGGRQATTTDADGTITATVYNELGWATQEQVGTSAGMTDVADRLYDVDGDLALETDHPGSNQPDRLTKYGYDGRDQLTLTTAGYGSAAPILTATAYDNAGDATGTQTFAGTPTGVNLRAESTTAYDDQGRVYAQTATNVNQATGATGATDTTSTYYDRRGLVLATHSPTGLWDKAVYNGAGWPTTTYSSQDATATWASAGQVANDVVLDQTAYTYDKDGNVVETEEVDRDSTDAASTSGTLTVLTKIDGFHDNSASSPSFTFTSLVYGRPTITDFYYDAADRPTATVAVGTNGYYAWTRAATVPLGSSTVLVTQDAYNAAGEVAAQTDPLGLVTAYTFDPLGRTLKTVADYTGTFNADGTPAGARTSNAANQTTAYTYDGDNNVTSMTAVMPTGQHSQTTDYVYGVTTAGGSGVNDADLLATTEYPSPTTGAASSSQAETTAYDALGEATGYTDRNGTTHAYTYDAFGRLTSDAVTQFGTGVDQAVKMLGYAYTDDGLLASATSYSSTAGGTANIVNQDVDAYDGFGQLASEEQAVTGAASVSSPTVGYTYDAANGDRLTGIVYPNGRTLTYGYGSPGSLTSAASQITSLSDGSGAIQSYTYLGLDTPVTFADGNGITLSYLAGDGGPGSNGGDQYTGLDEFGRVVDQDWVNTSGTAVDEKQYAYDADGNVLSRTDTVVTSQSETYAYDGLNRLTGFDRGTIDGTGTIASPTTSETWQLDAVGNWASNTVNNVTTTRTNNNQNQVTSVGSATLNYDTNGNTLTDGTGQQYVYDAWNRLMTVKNGSGTTIAAYTYDAQGRRVTEAYPGQLMTDLYYSKNWQVLEADVGGAAVQQYTWSPFNVDGLVARDDHDPATGGTSLNRRLYAEQDANDNVTSLTNASGAVVERYAYDPYGSVTVETASGTTEGNGTAAASAYGWTVLHQGLQLDVATGTYDNRARVYLVSLGRFAQEDPAGYADGASRYQFADSSPATRTDPTGYIPAEPGRDPSYGGAGGDYGSPIGVGVSTDPGPIANGAGKPIGTIINGAGTTIANGAGAIVNGVGTVVHGVLRSIGGFFGN